MRPPHHLLTFFTSSVKLRQQNGGSRSTPAANSRPKLNPHLVAAVTVRRSFDHFPVRYRCLLVIMRLMDGARWWWSLERKKRRSEWRDFKESESALCLARSRPWRRMEGEVVVFEIEMRLELEKSWKVFLKRNINRFCERMYRKALLLVPFKAIFWAFIHFTVGPSAVTHCNFGESMLKCKCEAIPYSSISFC